MRRLPALLLLGAALFVAFPPILSSFSIWPHSLNATENGFQVNASSFSQASANDNTTPDANFPGALGSALAAWKAAAEWSSELRAGNGNGDPLQPGDLGSGASNFDFMYEGTASNAGGTMSSVISAAGFLGAGVQTLSTFTDFGWQILLDDSPQNGWQWQDGPGNESVGPKDLDLQGLLAHELGHALGLGHSTVPGATMSATTTPANLPFSRSIEADDRAGLQWIYGPKTLTKPIVALITGNVSIGGTISIAGSNFTPTGNEVQFTRNTGGATTTFPQTPVKVVGIPSSGGGTSLTVTIPPGVARGELVVKRSGGSGADHSAKSAPFPFALLGPPVIAGFSPNPVPIAAPKVPVLLIGGTNFTGATSVSVGGLAYGPASFVVLNDSEILLTFSPPPPSAGAAIPVRVTTPLGTSTLATLTIAMPPAPSLLASTTSPASGGTFTLYFGAPQQAVTPLVSFSLCLTGFSFAPYFELEIGGCGDLGFLPIPPLTDASGISSFAVGVPPTFHGTAYLQALAIDLATPAFPLVATNVVTLQVP